MEPILPMPHGSPEAAPMTPRGPETPTSRGPESMPTIERPAPQEQQPASDAGSSPPPLPVVPLPPSQSAAADDTQLVTVHDDTNPAVAADDDLIEKEWVVKAKKVISETKHDPHAQEQAVSRLQADYLNKRYGKVIKLPQEE